MSPSQLIEQTKTKLNQAVSRFGDELKKMHTGRAHPSMLDGITVTAYGTSMPLIQVGNVTTPEPQLLQITPFDPSNLAAISAAIRDSSALGLNPMDDGRVVRIPIPPLTEERRREFTKVLGGKVEDCMVTLRNIRHDAIKDIDESKRDKSISEDEAGRLEKQVEDAMNQAKSEVESVAKTKETEIMTL